MQISLIESRHGWLINKCSQSHHSYIRRDLFHFPRHRNKSNLDPQTCWVSSCKNSTGQQLTIQHCQMWIDLDIDQGNQTLKATKQTLILNMSRVNSGMLWDSKRLSPINEKSDTNRFGDVTNNPMSEMQSFSLKSSLNHKLVQLTAYLFSTFWSYCPSSFSFVEGRLRGDKAIQLE